MFSARAVLSLVVLFVPIQTNTPAPDLLPFPSNNDPGPTSRRQHRTRADSLLAAGDTAAAIVELRDYLSREKSRREQCLLGALLARRVTNRVDDWQLRNEAQILFRSALSRDPDPGCLLAFAELKEKQQVPGEARRLARQAQEILIKRPELSTPGLLADLYFRRAQVLSSWTRNFENLVVITDLPVSSANCADPFCEGFSNPTAFQERLARAARIDNLVEDQRRTMHHFLDSALALDPSHPGAFPLALREAAIASDWKAFETLSRKARAHDPIAATPLLGVVTALVRQKRLEQASAAFDTLLQIIGPEALATLEGLALVADSSIRDRLAGQQYVVYAEAVWGLSDPLYMTPYNERRLEHYARTMLADVMFTDAGAGRAGRDTEQGRLVLRHGLPWKWYEVKADKSLELTQAQRDELAQLSAVTRCNDVAIGTRIREGTCIPIVLAESGRSMQGGGRWSFWFYAPNAPPMIFERSLGYLTARHMQFSQSRDLDSALYRAAPSTFESPYAEGRLQALVTRFPRPLVPAVEVHARFEWPGANVVRDSVRWGVVMHDPVRGSETGRSRVRASVPDSVSRFGEVINVPVGRTRLAVEARTMASDAAAQVRSTIEVTPPTPGELKMSDLLLGDSAEAPERIERRSQVRFSARTDSVYAPGAPIALYWEVYGLAPDNTAARAQIRVTVRIEDAGGRAVGTEVWRNATRLLGLRSGDDNTVQWEETKPVTAAIMPAVLVLTAPNDQGSYRVAITVVDIATGRVTTSERRIWLEKGN